MVKVIITEDDDNKRTEIVSFVESQGIPKKNIAIATTLAEFAAKLDSDVNVCIIDIRIPAYEGGEADQNGRGILQIIEGKSKGKVKLLAISAYPEEFGELRLTFERQGCLLTDFNHKEVWQNALRLLLLQSNTQDKFDFLIFVALTKERAPYTAFSELHGKAVTEDGITRYDVEIAGKSGAIIELPAMGLIDAAIMASKCIEKYTPDLVAMSGICAGFPENAKIGQLLISELSFEYQSGKWTTDGFKQRPYQVPVSDRIRVLVHHLVENKELNSQLETGWSGPRPSELSFPKFGVFTSGSAVIADETYISQIAEQHDKVSGLDMEVHAIHRAGYLSRSNPDVLCAKVVVDLANSEKDDKIQDYGCYVSSRFIVQAVREYYNRPT